MAVGERLSLGEAMESGWTWAWTPTGVCAHALLDDGSAICGVSNAVNGPNDRYNFLACAECSEAITHRYGARMFGDTV